MKNMSNFSYLSTFIILVLVLTACPGTETPEQTRDASRLVGTAVTQTRAAYNGPAEDLFITNDSLENVLQVGSISATGEIDVTLPETLPETLLIPLSAEFLPDEASCEPSTGLTTSDANTLITSVGDVFTGLATSSGQALYEFDSGMPAFSEEADAIDFVPLLPQDTTFIVKFYVNRDVNIQGTCIRIEQSGEFTSRDVITFDTSLKRGWNDVTLSLELREFEGGRVFETTGVYTTGVVPDETQLFIFPAD